MMAWKHMTSLLSLNKDYTPALEARSMISFQMGNTFGALLDISEALRYDVNPQYYTERGAIHQYIGDSRNAVLDYERALHLDPNYPLAHYNLGNILLQQGLYKQASQRYTAVINIVPNDDSALINRALCYTAIGEKELALMDLNKAIICNPYASHAYLNRGNLLRADNRLQEAEYDYCKAVDLQPDDALSRYYYGEVLSLLGKKAEAHEQFFKSTSS
jgi:tetratricopeptide (TPR) repeat protein